MAEEKPHSHHACRQPPRPQDAVDLVFAEDRGDPVDPDEYDQVIGEAVRDRVQHQVQAGIDLVSDGEMSKIGYATLYPPPAERIRVGDRARATPADLDAYPRFRGPSGPVRWQRALT